MIIAGLFILGVCLGSFVNALVWRIHEQAKPLKKRAASDKQLSVMTGRSMCPQCQHQLSGRDLVPILSWLSLGGKCRYCKTVIGWQYPLVELAGGALLVFSYVYWPSGFELPGLILFISWAISVPALLALTVYDARWKILPDRIVFPLGFLWVFTVMAVSLSLGDVGYLAGAVLGALVGGGIFWILFQISDGLWIGGGDVKLGAVLGLMVASPLKATLIIFLASYIGTVVALTGFLTKQRSLNKEIPFGPSLILATIILVLFGDACIRFYRQFFAI